MLRVVDLPLAEAAAAIRTAWDAGDAVAPVDPRATAAEGRDAMAAIRRDEPLDPAVAAVVCTSGTTGEPKAVELTWAGLRHLAQWVATTEDDAWALTLPVHRVGGLAVVARAWAAGLPLVPPDDPRASLASFVPTQILRLADPSRFRHILVGGGPVPGDIAALANVAVTYGMTETWGGVVHDGYPLAGVEIDLAADGEILLRTPTIMRGYRGGAPLAAGTWWPTGDVGILDEHGRLSVVDRRRDLVITGGVNVSPTEVERILLTHPAVADVCVAGLPDDEWGERVVAYVVVDGRAPTVDELREHARSRLSGPKLPRQVVVVDAIPRSPAGKPLRRMLRGVS